MKLHIWLQQEKGRSSALAKRLGVTRARVTQMATDGVPVKHMRSVLSFTKGKVKVEDMLPSDHEGETQVQANQPAPSAAAPAGAQEVGHG